MIIEVAGIKVKIKHHYPYTKWICENYIIKSNTYDIALSVTKEQIKQQLKDSCGVSAAVCESFLLLDQLNFSLLKYDAYLLHAAVAAVEGKAYAFSAKSGTGKSTHIEQWKKCFGEQAVIINGDKPFLRRMDNKLFACGSPWCGKEGLETNTMVPLQALCFLERGEKNEISLIEQKEVIDLIFRQLRLPDNEKQMEKLLELLDWTVQHIPCYRLRCTISEDAARVAYEEMKV